MEFRQAERSEAESRRQVNAARWYEDQSELSFYFG
jgi:hypothetical protein